MQFISASNIDFMGKRKFAMFLSAVLLLTSLVSLGVRGLNFGIDFTGGVLVEVGYSESVELEPLREGLEAAGFKNVSVLHFGTSKDVLVRLPPVSTVEDGIRHNEKASKISDHILKVMSPLGKGMTMRRVEFVGPQIGEELTEQGGLAMLFALGAILIYVALRFEWRFALGSVSALIHDVIITLGVFSVAQFDFDLTVLAALLAVIGYSLNDTIVVFDRIRENFVGLLKGDSVEVVNSSINQTLGRTVMTSITTMVVLVALIILGGEVIFGFAAALIVGVFVGTYSSIFVASSAALALGVTKEDLIPTELEPEGDEFRESDEEEFR
jgi:preprotein translocase subunit SecF